MSMTSFFFNGLYEKVSQTRREATRRDEPSPPAGPCRVVALRLPWLKESPPAGPCRVVAVRLPWLKESHRTHRYNTRPVAKQPTLPAVATTMNAGVCAPIHTRTRTQLRDAKQAQQQSIRPGSYQRHARRARAPRRRPLAPTSRSRRKWLRARPLRSP
jgi:hypothetical protein